jgi:hypothetical protein
MNGAAALAVPATELAPIEVHKAIQPSEIERQTPDGVAYHDLYRVIPPRGAYNSYEVIIPRPPVGAIVVMPIGMGSCVNFLKVRSGTALKGAIASGNCGPADIKILIMGFGLEPTPQRAIHYFARPAWLRRTQTRSAIRLIGACARTDQPREYLAVHAPELAISV